MDVLSLFRKLPNFLYCAKMVKGRASCGWYRAGSLLCRTEAVVIALSSSVHVLHVTCLLHLAISRNVAFKQTACVSSVSFKLGKIFTATFATLQKVLVVKLRHVDCV
jgi:hypothetical protein